MKIKIKSFNGELPSYLTLGKEYKVNEYDFLNGYSIINDLNDETFIALNNSAHLNGGSWEIIE